MKDSLLEKVPMVEADLRSLCDTLDDFVTRHPSYHKIISRDISINKQIKELLFTL